MSFICKTYHLGYCILGSAWWVTKLLNSLVYKSLVWKLVVLQKSSKNSLKMVIHEYCLCVCFFKLNYVILLIFMCTIYCEILFCLTFNFVFFVRRAIHKFEISTKYLFTLVILCKILNSQNQVPTNILIVVKPRNFVPL